MVTEPSKTPVKPDYAKLSTAFTPHKPILLREFLAGRLKLLYRIEDASNTEGLHVVLYGDRGTGKTSLARVAAFMLQEDEKPNGRRSILVSCTSRDDFPSLWRKVGQEILLSQRQLGFAQHETATILGRVDLNDTVTTPNDARIFLQSLPNPTVIVIDEFDRLPAGDDARRLMADTIKLFADYNVHSTLLIVGVGKSLNDLLAEHQSIVRNIAQIPVEPMDKQELAQIITTGYKFVGLGFEEGLDMEIAELSQGYPHYTHLLGLWAGRRAEEGKRPTVTLDDLQKAIPDVSRNAEGSLLHLYEQAVHTAKKTAIFRQVLLACALARKDSLGGFPVGALVEPLRMITGKTYKTASYQVHLAKFCENTRGPILERSGEKKNYHWRFLNPQVIPYIILQGISQEMISSDQLSARQRA